MALAARTTTVVDALHAELRARILAGTERPGTALTELSVAAAHQVARPTAKAAIERLISEGLLTRVSRRAGPTVPLLTRTDIEDLYDTRAAIESHAHRVLGRTAPILDDALTYNRALRAAADRGDAAEVVAADIEFHRALVRQVGSARLERVHDLLMSEAHFCMGQVQALQLLGASEIAGEHDRIVEAIGSGDVKRIDEVTGYHLDHARVKLIGRLFDGDVTPAP